MKHIIKSNLYLTFWSEKFFNLAILAGMVVLVLVLQGDFSAYVIGIYLSTFMCLLKMNSMDKNTAKITPVATRHLG